MTDEEKVFTLTIEANANDTLMDVAVELAELVNESKYTLTFIYKGESLPLSTKLGEKHIFYTKD